MRHFSLFMAVKCIVFVLFFHPALAIGSSIHETETLKEAYFSMLSSNPNIFESKANEQAARQAFLQLRAGYFPVIGLAYNLGRGKGQAFSPQTFNIGYSLSSIQHRMISVSQLLFDGGALANKVAGAKSQYEAASQQTLLQINQLALRAVSAYLSILRNYEMEQIALENVHMHQHRLHQESERYHRGAGTAAEYYLAQTRLQESELVLNRSELELSNANATYLEVIGHYPPPLTMPIEPSGCMPESLEAAKDISHYNNPAIIASQNLVRAAYANVAASNRAMYWPNVTLQMNAFRDFNPNAVPARNTTMQAYLAINYNIFNGGSDQATLRKAAAELNASKDRLENQRRQIDLAIEQSWYELNVAKKSLSVLKKRVKAARDLIIVYNKELELGKRSLLDVMNTENELYNVRASLVDVRYKIKIDFYALLASGGLLADFLTNEPGKNLVCLQLRKKIKI